MLQFWKLLAICLLATLPVRAQLQLPRFVAQMFADTGSAASARVLVLPTASFSPETSLSLGVRAFTLYHARHDTTVNRLSQVALASFVTLRGQFSVQFENAVYSDKNRYSLLGRAQYQQFPLLYYGIGPDTPADTPILVESASILIRERLLRQVRGNWYGGIEFDFQSVMSVNLVVPPGQTLSPLIGQLGGRTSGLGLALVYDDRQNVLHVRRGAFLEVAGLAYRPAFGSQFTYESIIVDARLYRPLGRPNRVLAMQVFGTFQRGDVPFYSLALLGGEALLRGYYLGRYRDKTLLTTQAEVRWLPFGFSKRIGGNVFGGLGTVAPTLADVQARYVRWVAGFGLQFLLLPSKDAYLRGDLGFTREGTGIYFSLGQAF
jgi:hypothetical protein